MVVDYGTAWIWRFGIRQVALFMWSEVRNVSTSLKVLKFRLVQVIQYDSAITQPVIQLPANVGRKSLPFHG